MWLIAAIICNADESSDSTRHASQREAAKETAGVMIDAEIVLLVGLVSDLQTFGRQHLILKWNKSIKMYVKEQDGARLS